MLTHLVVGSILTLKLYSIIGSHKSDYAAVSRGRTYLKILPFINREKSDMCFTYEIANGNGSEAQLLDKKQLPNRKSLERLYRKLCKTKLFCFFGYIQVVQK